MNVAALLARVVFAQRTLAASEDDAGKQRRYTQETALEEPGAYFNTNATRRRMNCAPYKPHGATHKARRTPSRRGG